jgi:hypothetical protein
MPLNRSLNLRRWKVTTPELNQIIAAGGLVEDVDIDGVNYRVHTFNSSGNFVVLSAGSAPDLEYLIVAGGGGGGANGGAGGGAGGVLHNIGGTPYVVSEETYPIVVGSGGINSTGGGLTSTYTAGSNGTNSVAFGVTAFGGGLGGNGGDRRSNGAAGGSGGGSSAYNNSQTGGAGSSGQGNRGGNTTSSSNRFAMGGGGGAGAPGEDIISPAASDAGDGGIGIELNIRGALEYFGGGGAGGSSGLATAVGGLGGGGDTQSNGIDGRGGGGGGGGFSGFGGDGIVIIRYQYEPQELTPPDATLYYTPITIQNSKVSAPLSGFPVYVDLSLMPADFWSNVQSDGGDIRVTNANNTIRLPVEVVFIDTASETGELHFLANSLSDSTDTAFRIYYGSTSPLSQPAADSPYGTSAVWTAYEAVWHIHEDPTAGAPQFYDSTGNGFNGTAAGSIAAGARVNGRLSGKAIDFDGVNDAINMPVGLNAANDRNFSISLWARPDSVTSPTLRAIAGITTFDINQAEYNIRIINSKYAIFTRDSANQVLQATAPSNAPINTWTHVVGTVKGDNITLYQNGTQVASAQAAHSNPDTSGRIFAIGYDTARGPADHYPFDGIIDEVRVMKQDASPAYVLAEYNNQSDPGTFYVVGSHTSVG